MERKGGAGNTERSQKVEAICQVEKGSWTWERKLAGVEGGRGGKDAWHALV